MTRLLQFAWLQVAIAAYPWYLVDVPLSVCGGQEEVTLLLPLQRIAPADRQQPHVFSVIRSTGNVSFTIKAEDLSKKLVTEVTVKLDSPETAKAIATDAAQANDSSNSTVPATPSSSTNSPSAETQSANGTGLKGNDSTANKPDDIPKGSNASKAGSQGGKVPEGGNAPQGGNEPEKANASQRGNVSAEGGLPDGKGLESQGGSVPRAGNVPEGGNMSEEGNVSEEGDGNDRHSPDIARATKEPAALEKPHADEVLEDAFDHMSFSLESSRQLSQRRGGFGRRGGFTPSRRRSFSPSRRRTFSPPRRRTFSPQRRRTFSPPRRRTFQSPRRRRSVGPSYQSPRRRGWQNRAHPGPHYNYRPPAGYQQRPYGYRTDNYYRPHQGNGAKIAMAGAAGFVGGAAVGHMVSSSRYSRWNTMTYGRRNGQNQSRLGKECHFQDFTGDCSTCFKRFGAENCRVNYDYPEAASRDDLMATAFLPRDYSRALRVTLTKIAGPDLAKERICPPDGWHWDPKLSNYTGKWVPPDKQDIFITLTKVEKEVQAPAPSPPDKPRQRPARSGKDAMMKTLYIFFAIASIILLVCLCCCCGGNKSAQPQSGPNEMEMEGFSSRPMARFSAPVPGMAAPVGMQPPMFAGSAAVTASAVGTRGTATASGLAPNSVRTCPHMHPLRAELNQSHETNCDECHKEQDYGHQVYRCDPCDFDVCSRCIQLTSFIDEPAYEGTTSWKNFLVNEPIVDSQGLLAGPWGDALRAAVLYEVRQPSWPQEERFLEDRNGPAGQVIAFLEAKGFGMFEATAEHTEDVLRENPHMLRG